MLGNLLAVATALGLPAKVVCGFVDDEVNAVLDVDIQREVAFSMVALGYNPAIRRNLPPRYRPSGLRNCPAPRSEIDYPII